MKTAFNRTRISLIATLFAIAAIGCATTSSEKQLEEEQKAVSTHLKIFDDLDYRVYSHQQWNDLHLSHLSDIKVHWPDGHVTNGTEKHIEDLKAMFVWAPDTRIEEHPVKLGQKDWTAVIGVMQGTFTRAMPIGEEASTSNQPGKLTS